MHFISSVVLHFYTVIRVYLSAPMKVCVKVSHALHLVLVLHFLRCECDQGIRKFPCKRLCEGQALHSVYRAAFSQCDQGIL